MFFELIATFAVGFAAAGVVMLLNKLAGGALPRWLTPVVAGAAMLGLTIWSEYTWFERTRATLPEGMEVVITIENQTFYQPWTYLTPYVSRFAAVDQARTMENPAAPGYKLAPVVFMGRWAPVRQIRMMFDCAGKRRVDLVEGVELDDKGLPSADTPWLALDADDALMRAVCADV